MRGAPGLRIHRRVGYGEESTARRIAGKQLREVPLPGDALILAVVREGEMVIPRRPYPPGRGDYLTLVGSARRRSGCRGGVS